MATEQPADSATDIVMSSTAGVGGIPTGFSRRCANVNGTRLSYLVGGTGAPILLLHGWPQTALAWRHVLAPLAERGNTIIAPDLRGLGSSIRALSGYDKQNQAEDIRGLLDAIGFGSGTPVRLVGHDIGGMIAFAYARTYPADVERLVLMELAVPGFGLEESMDVARGGLWHFGLFMTPEVPELLFQGHEREFFRWWFAHMSGEPTQFSPSEIDQVTRAYSGEESLRCGFDHYRTLLDDGAANRKWYDAGGRLDMPVLAVGGGRGSGDRLGDSLQNACSQITTVVVADSGHFLAEERPDELLGALRKFFG